MVSCRDTFSLVLSYLVVSLAGCDAQSQSLSTTPPGSECYGKFGCYSNTYPWISESRPITYFPESPEKVAPVYCLYTRRTPTTCDVLEIDRPETLYASSYVPRGQVYFISHGFVENGNKPWIKKLTAELLARSSANVIVIDWSGGSSPPYAQAVANIRLVGVMTAHLIKMMSEEVVGLRVEQIHVIGHSLGAHLASYIGNTLRRTFKLRLGRISGLDPAGPHFADTDPMVRLDPTDAIFVDNIHTDSSPFMKGGLGILEPVGHVDFYPNGGKDQPGCEKLKARDGSMTLLDGMRKMLGCSHVRSFEYFIESVNARHKWLGVECPSWDHYLNGSCFECTFNPAHENNTGTVCARFGFHSIRAFATRRTVLKVKGSMDVMLQESPARRHVTLYLTTGSSSPYYRNQYRVRWKIAEGGNREMGMFRLAVVGSTGVTEYMDLSAGKELYEPGSNHTAVVASNNVGSVKSAKLEWFHKAELWNPFSWRVSVASMKIEHLVVDSLETGESLTLCTPDNQLLVDGAPVHLTTSCNLI